MKNGYGIVLVLALSITCQIIMGCSILSQKNDSKNSLYKKETACRNTKTGHFVSSDHCKN